MDDLTAKRIRRCEVTGLELAEEISEIRQAQRALYESLILLAGRIPNASTVGADPIDTLMLPPWFKDSTTGNVLPPPEGLNLDTKGLAAFRLQLSWLDDEQRAQIRLRQLRHRKLVELLRTREKEREAKLKKPTRTKGMEIGG